MRKLLAMALLSAMMGCQVKDREKFEIKTPLDVEPIVQYTSTPNKLDSILAKEILSHIHVYNGANQEIAYFYDTELTDISEEQDSTSTTIDKEILALAMQNTKSDKMAIMHNHNPENYHGRIIRYHPPSNRDMIQAWQLSLYSIRHFIANNNGVWQYRWKDGIHWSTIADRVIAYDDHYMEFAFAETTATFNFDQRYDLLKRQANSLGIELLYTKK
jgi:hypothetical protein